MKTKITITVLLLIASVCKLNAQINVGLETGVVFSGYNDARVPGDGGTMVSLSGELKGDPFLFFRLNASYNFNKRHNIGLLFAPLQTTYSGSVDKEILFGNTTFAPNTDLEATYKFNSYRLTYRYDIVMNSKFEFGLGFTAKIRDAKIALKSSVSEDEKTNLGFVPIINFRLAWHCTDKFGVLLQGDALAAPQGRAEDVLIAGTYKFSDNLQVHAGYRILEGGGDVESVYSFANFNYLALGVSYTFNLKK